METADRIKKAMRKVARELLLKQIYEERYILERRIFPRTKQKKVLWVGCANYTKDYITKLEKNKNQVWTIDILPEMKKFGSKKHITDSISNIDQYFKKNFLDTIFLTGVFGYGLEDKKEAEKTLKNCHKILKKNGNIIIWWADRSERNQINPRELKNFNLYKNISLLGYKSGYRTKKNVVLEFLEKK